MADIAIKFGKRIKTIRLKQKLSQGQLAKILGVHPTDISAVERGLRNMTLKNMERFATALNVSVNDLLI
jgi:transcriptional regulator with XRE-family HTH domain